MRWQDYGAILTVMLGIVAATVTGFVREAVLAHQLGIGPGADIYLTAFTIPEFAFLALPIVLTAAFVPLFADCRLRAGEAAAWRFGLRVAGALLLILSASVTAAALGAPLYLRWLAPGFDPDEFVELIRAVRMMLPAIILMGGATLAGAALQVYRRFSRPALATAVYNMTFVAALLALPLTWVVGRAAWGVTLGAGAALMIQTPLLWRHRPRSLFSRQESEEENKGNALPVGVKQFFFLAGPLAIGYAVHHLIKFVDVAMATTLVVGSVAILNYAYRLALVVGQLSGLAVSTVMFPRLAEQAAKDDVAGMQASLSQALRFVWTVGLPASCGLIILRAPLVQVLFERGAFGQGASSAVCAALVWYAPAVLADAICQPLWRVIYAWRSGWTVVAVNGLQTVLRILGNIVLIRFFGYNDGYQGLALSAALGLSVQMLVLGWLVRRRFRVTLVGHWGRDAGRVVLATIVAAVATSALAGSLSALPALGTLLICGTMGTLVYLATLGLIKYRRNLPSGSGTNRSIDNG